MKRAFWQSLRFAINTIGLMLCGLIFPFAMMVRGLSHADLWVSRRAALASYRQENEHG